LHPTDETMVMLRSTPRLFPDTDGQSPIGLGTIIMKVTVQGSVGSVL